MVIPCPQCRDLVHIQCGYIQRHGTKNHNKTDVCSASGTPYKLGCNCDY